MRKSLLSLLSILILITFWFSSCSEVVQVNAPPKNIWVVYGVLNPQEDYQYIRISKAFLPESNAIDIAREKDPSAKGLTVKLSGLGKEYVATQMDSVLKDTSEGDFPAYTTLYRFETKGDFRLKEEGVYNLEVLSPADSSLSLTAYTRIPPRPQVTYPITTTITGRKCLPIVSFEDSVTVYFRKQRRETFSSAMRYELRVFLRYFENGRQKTIHTKPTPLFNEDTNCNQISDHSLCYRFGKGQIINQLKNNFADLNNAYYYDESPICGNPFTDLAEAVEIQVTAVDTFLSQYIVSNDPRFVNYNTFRREFTNISGTQDAVGIFGSIAYHNVAVAFSSCTEFKLGLNRNWDEEVCE